MARLITVGLAGLLLGACADPGPATDTTATNALREGVVATTSPTSTSSETIATTTTGSKRGSVSGDLDPALSDYIELARRYLASRMGLSPDVIAVISAEAVVWPDSSLGCPQPGMAYLQVLTDGYRIILEANDTEYAYHGATDKPPFYCEQPS